MFSWLGINAVNPLLLWGGLAVASPIIIHLLARRRFRVVHWAAMDFLLDAEKRNRRRIRLEHLLLLLLRCLAILLIAFLVSRLFHTSTGLASLVGQAARTERIVLLDDSPSMQARDGNKTVLDRATAALAKFVTQTAQERPGDTMTLLLASNPDKPLINGQYFEKAPEIGRSLEQIEGADASADFAAGLLAVLDLIDRAEESGAGSINRVVYIVTDLRRRDWPEGDESDKALPTMLKQLADRTDGVVVVNVGKQPEPNLSVAEITPQEKAIVAGVPARFEVTIANTGPADSSDVQVNFIAGDAPPLVGYVDAVRSGNKAVVPFTFVFRDPGSAKVRVEIGADALPADNSREFAARVRQGVKVLLVDGDPSSEIDRSETYLLQQALQPAGGARTGNAVDVITENQFQSADFGPYQVIYLANVYQVTAQQADALEAWVKAGGGLIVALGDQVDPDIYAQNLYRDGAGLLPVKLEQIIGDPTARTWANLDVLKENHPIVSVFSGSSNPYLQLAKFFRWWQMTVADEMADGTQPVRVANFTDADASPAIVERSFGAGRVVVFATSIDRDWNDWTDPSYIITALETVRHMARSAATEGNVGIGEPLIYPLNISRYQAKATLSRPDTTDPVSLQAIAATPDVKDEDEAATEGDAAPAEDAEAPAAPAAPATTEQSAGMVFRYDEVSSRGFYTLALQPYDGDVEPVLFAAAIDPTESDQEPAATVALRKTLEESNVQFVEGVEYLDAGATGGRAEMWRGILIALVIVLCAEQLLAWVFGRRR